MAIRGIRKLCAAFGCSAVMALGTASAAMANNVEALLEGEQLKLYGDNAANSLTVAQNARGDVIVTGRNGTLVNGLPSVRFRLAFLDNVEILMGGGNDDVIVNGLIVNNDLFVNLGGGNDRVRSGQTPTAILNNLSIEGGAGNDQVILNGWNVGSDAAIDGQVGGLTARLIRLNVGFSITCIGDMARDVVQITDCSTGDFVNIESKAGNDLVELTGVMSLGTTITTDEGVDTVRITDLVAMDDVAVTSGKDNDVVELVNVSTSKNVAVSTDEGADTVSVAGVTAKYDAVLVGGAGVDTYIDAGISAGKIEVKEFEILL